MTTNRSKDGARTSRRPNGPARENVRTGDHNMTAPAPGSEEYRQRCVRTTQTSFGFDDTPGDPTTRKKGRFKCACQCASQGGYKAKLQTQQPAAWLPGCNVDGFPGLASSPGGGGWYLFSARSCRQEGSSAVQRALLQARRYCVKCVLVGGFPGWDGGPETTSVAYRTYSTIPRRVSAHSPLYIRACGDCQPWSRM